MTKRAPKSKATPAPKPAPAPRTRRRVKSSITRLPAEQREYIERLLRDGRLTLKEMIADLEAKFPGEPAAKVSRSALHRFDQRIAESAQEIREIEAAAGALVGQLGEGFGSKSADYLTQAITVIGVKAAMRAKDNPDLGTKEAKDLALMAKHALDAKRMNVAQRQAIQKEARQTAAEEAVQEAREGGVSEATIEKIRDRVLRGGA